MNVKLILKNKIKVIKTNNYKNNWNKKLELILK